MSTFTQMSNNSFLSIMHFTSSFQLNPLNEAPYFWYGMGHFFRVVIRESIVVVPWMVHLDSFSASFSLAVPVTGSERAIVELLPTDGDQLHHSLYEGGLLLFCLQLFRSPWQTCHTDKQCTKKMLSKWVIE